MDINGSWCYISSHLAFVILLEKKTDNILTGYNKNNAGNVVKADHICSAGHLYINRICFV